MSWLRIDDGFPSHPKLQGWTPAQKWALVELFCYCARHKTEGYVPSDLSLLPRAVTGRLLSLAEDSGVLDRDEDDCLIVHDWQRYNPSDVTAAERMKRMRERNAERNAKRNGTRNKPVTPSVTTHARDPVPSPAVTADAVTALRPRNELWDALTEVFGEARTETAKSLRGKVVRSLAQAGATPDEVLSRARSWPSHFDSATLTETALEKHWDALGRKPLRMPR